MTVITRFAPSPTGKLHIGSARTALFNWLFSRHHNGKFLLRIEDTDRARSTKESIDAILDGMNWLGLDYDSDPIYQFSRAERHKEIALEMVERGMAYFCYTSQEDINMQRELDMREKRSFLFHSEWRDSDKQPPIGINPVVRIKAPKEGVTIVKDMVQGDVVVQNDHLDDMVLLRSDGTPTYMLAVVVDDHDMEITHIIRGDDHLNNASRQQLIYNAMGWDVPIFAHIPLIHGADGAKMSKRHGATAVSDYADMGYLPEAMKNYLLRLGWSHGNEEIISTDQAINWFNLESINKGPSRFDYNKLNSINHHYISESSDDRIIDLMNMDLDDVYKNRLKKAMVSLKKRSNTIVEIIENAQFLLDDDSFSVSEEELLKITEDKKSLLVQVIEIIESSEEFSKDYLFKHLSNFANSLNLKIGIIGELLRICLTGKSSGMSAFEVMEILGKEISINRIKSILN